MIRYNNAWSALGFASSASLVYDVQQNALFEALRERIPPPTQSFKKFRIRIIIRITAQIE